MSEVCQCPDEDHTIPICVGQYQASMNEADRWFKMLKKYCGNNDGMKCKVEGAIFCTTSTCVLLK